ncbi:MAG: hypothetical protein KZQ85_04210 [Candidatus Thiodiazotropha sp. (ex Myrtea sp. 'scaly one' KF741663)]|nr:hypothetical protein [Candidatus Thiodiazotropha sp. (ex Myrtea sp. 'scaly one' KF741663)]
MRKNIGIVLVLSILAFSKQSYADQDSILLLQKCPESQPCVLMTLNNGKNKATTKHINQLDDGYSEILFSVNGNFENSVTNTYLLKIKARAGSE